MQEKEKKMGYEFLSDKWFEEFEKIRATFGEIEVPKRIKGVIVNLDVTDGPQGGKEAHFTEGRFGKGFHENAMTTLTLSFDLCKRALLGNDTKAAMKGFMTRKIRMKGDITKMLKLASIKADGDLEALRATVWDITE
jgi:hypothetical protein